MLRLTSLFLSAMILCTCFYACGGDDENKENTLWPTPSGGEIVAGTTFIDPQVPESDEPQPADPEPVEPEPTEPPAVAPGGFGPAPLFRLPNLNGNLVSLADFKGHNVVVVNFWATWCTPYRAEIPDFIKVYEKPKDRRMTLLRISRDIGTKDGKLVKDEKVIRNFMKEFNTPEKQRRWLVQPSRGHHPL